MLTKLTSEQQAVVTHSQGHARVRAVAGSGKTTTLVARLLHLLQQGVPPQRLLVVMYNRAAKEDFSAKLAASAQTLQAQGVHLRLPEVRTFHSLGFKLSRSLQNWGYLPARKLVQEEWLEDRLTRQALSELASEQGATKELSSWLEEDALDEFKSFCTLVKSGLASPEQVNADLDNGHKHFAGAFQQLEQLLADQKLMFFDDLIWRPVQALEKNPELIPRLQGFLDHLIVDEYQDINSVQQRLLKSLAGKAQVMVVGDLDQCIYEWRGAKPEYMLHRLQQDFQPLADYPLSSTFRFGHGLALAANQCIVHNQERIEQLTLANNQAPLSALSQGQGSAWLIAQLRNWQQTQAASSQPATAAILVRSWAQSLDVQLELLNRQQAFSLPNNEHFIFNRPQIKALLAYARLSLHSQAGTEINFQHPVALEDFNQLLSFPTLYLTQVEKQQLLNARQESAPAFNQALEKLPQNKAKKVAQRLALLQQLARLALKLTPDKFLEQVLKLTDALAVIKKTAPSKTSAAEAQSLILGLQNYAALSAETSLANWLEKLELAQQQGKASLHAAPSQQLAILTVHAAKGLEWDWVGVYALNEGDFPYTTGFGRLTPQQEEAERRLFYVAITRAKQHLVLASNNSQAQPSRFLAEANLDQAQRLAQLIQQQKKPASFADFSCPSLAQTYWQQAMPETSA